jgi:hypothetical protein
MAKRKSQASTEFLMTYGWGILAVLVAIGALAYFGVLDPNKILPDKCTLGQGLYCKSHKAETTGLTMMITNSLGKDITITGVTFPEKSSCSISGLSISVANDATATVFAPCNITKGSKVKTDAILIYDEIRGLPGMSSLGTFSSIAGK